MKSERQLMSLSQEAPRGKHEEDNNNPTDEKMVREDASSGIWYPQDKDETYTCCCFWRPRWAQKLLCPVFFLVCVCLVVLGDAIGLGAFTGTITSIETRYRLTASNLGVLVTAYSVGNMAALPFVSYFGGRPGSDRPRWIASGGLVIGLGIFLNALPQFVFGEYDAVPSSGQVDPLVCSADNATDRCSAYHTVGAKNDAAFWIMTLSSAICGAGYAAIPTLGVSYIDDNCRTATTALYAGIMESMYGVGSMLGFFISSYSLTLWVDFYRVGPAEVADIPSPDHPAWVGAWWLGLLVCSAFAFLSCLPLFGFPKRLPERFRRGSDAEPGDGAHIKLAEGSGYEDKDSEAGQKAQEIHEKDSAGQNVDSNTAEGPVKGLVITYFRLMRNPVLMFITLGMVFQLAILYGFSTFFAKYLESQFDVTASFADILTGVALIPPYGVGWILGGYIVRKTQMRYSNMFLFALGASLVGLVGFLLMLFTGCNNPKIAGVTAGYEGQSLSQISLVADCNTNCSCTAASYQPMCDVMNDVIYFSPCFSGCSGTSDNSWYNCSCLAGSQQPDAGLCDNHCNTLVPFIAMQILQTIAFTMGGAPQVVLILRFVNTADKTAALGFNRLLTSIGALVGPMVFGWVVDQSCLVWQSECGESGSCLVYDIEQYRYLFVGLCLAAGTLGVAGMCPAYYFIRKTVRKRAGDSQLPGGNSYITLTDAKKVDDTED